MAIPDLRAGAPLYLVDAVVRADQLNASGHLRAALYVQLFEDAVKVFFPKCGIADGDLLHGGTSPFLLDLHTCYLAELRQDDRVSIDILVLDVDPRRVRLFLTMKAKADHRICATTELHIINIDMGTRRPIAWDPGQQAAWNELVAAHRDVPSPPQAGRAIRPLAG